MDISKLAFAFADTYFADRDAHALGYSTEDLDKLVEGKVLSSAFKSRTQAPPDVVARSEEKVYAFREGKLQCQERHENTAIWEDLKRDAGVVVMSKRPIRAVINELAIDNCNHLALHGLDFPQISHPEANIFQIVLSDPRVIPVISLTVMTVSTILGITEGIDFDQEIEWPLIK